MADFTHLQGLRVQDDTTVEFTFYRIAGEPSLDVRPAHQSNREFFNAALKRSKAAMRKARGRSGQALTAEAIEQARQEDVILFAKYVVTGWSGVVDSGGEPVEFSEEVCVQFLQAIPEDMFTELRAFCLDIDNFRDDVMDQDEQEDLLGN